MSKLKLSSILITQLNNNNMNNKENVLNYMKQERISILAGKIVQQRNEYKKWLINKFE
jgi:hypothetical protein